MKLKQILFIFLTLQTFLSAKVIPALPPLVEKGEVFDPKTYKENFYIDKQSSVNSVAISNDGKTIVSGSGDGSIKVWERKSGKLLKILDGHTSRVKSVAISQNTKYIVSGSSNGSVKIWERESGKLLKTLKGHTGSVNSVTISQDSKYIISGSGKVLIDMGDTSVKIWERESGKLIKTLKEDMKYVLSVAISKDTKYIVAGSDKGIKIWERESGKLLRTLKEHKSSVISVAISKDSKYIVSGSGDNNIKIWERESGKLLKTLKGHKSSVTSVAISKDSKYIVSGSDDNNIKIWERESGKLLKTLKGHKSSVFSIAISQDAKYIVSGSDDNRIKIWERKSGELLKTLKGHKSFVFSIAISQDAKYIVSGSPDNSVKIWERESGKLLKILKGHTNYVKSVAISKDSKYIVSGSWDNSVKIWERESGKLLKTLEGHTGSVNSVAISQDAKYIVSGSMKGGIVIWERESGKLLKVFKKELHIFIDTISISHDAQYIVSANSNTKNNVNIWERKSGKLLKTLKENFQGTIKVVAITQDAKYIVLGSGRSVEIWERESGKLLKTLEKNTGFVNSIAISQDTQYIVLGYDNGIKILDRESGKLLKTLEGDTQSIQSVRISYDSKYIVSGSSDGNVKIWDRASGKLLKALWGARNGCWQSMDFEATPPVFYRGDNGKFLYKRDGVNLSSSYPKEFPKNDALEIKVTAVKIKNSTQKTIEVKLKNLKNQNIYWLRVQGEGNFSSIRSKQIPILKANEEKTVSLLLSASLTKENPKPLIDKLRLRITTANEKEFQKMMLVEISHANIEVQKVEESEDGKNLNILVKNIGNEKLIKADVNLSFPFQADIQSLTNLEANVTKALSFVLPKDYNETKGLNITFSVVNEEEILKNPSGTKVAPAYIWKIENVPIELKKLAWYIYALWALGILLLLALILYYKRYKNPLVVKLSETPKELLTLSPKLLAQAQEKLSTINRWETVLESSDISQERVTETLAFFTNSSEEKAKLFCERIGANFSEEKPFYRIHLPKGFDLNIDTFLLYFSDESAKNIKKEIIDLDDKVLVVGSQKEQNELFDMATDKTNRIIAPSSQKLSEFLLSSQSEKVLIGIFAECLLFKDISPYQVNSGVSNASNFFGRVEIIRDIVTKENANFLIVGARQLGKSSIIKALERRYESSSKVTCYSFTMDDENIVLAMSTALGMSSKSTLEEVVSEISKAPKKSLFLIDEADRFIKNEKEVDYKVTEAFRKLSQNGKATFVLTGFWTLYFYVTSDYHSPLKNFGELVKLEGLDHESCKALMTEPMKRIGVSYENDSVIEHVIKLCGQRPNLIAITCNEVLKELEGKVISQNDIDAVVENSSLEDYLKGWGSMSSSESDNRLDRVIVYLTLEKERFRLSDVVALLKGQGLEIDVNHVNKSLERLVVGYIFEERKKNYSYRVPLFREKLLEDDIEILLDGDVEGLK